ncbi:MAG: ATP-binding protein [bacterium]
MDRKTLLFLRFILILVTILVMTYSKKGLSILEPGYFIALIYFISNFILYRIPKRIFAKPLLAFAMFLFDIIAISLAVYFTQGMQTDFYLIYFLVIFVASVGQNITGSLPTAIVASIIYGWLLYKANPGISFVDSKILIRIPFLFILALMSSYWSQATRRELKKKDELERFNKELQKEVTRVAAEEIELRKYSEKIINSVTSGVIAVSSDGMITTLNPEAARSLGIKGEDVIGMDIRKITGLGTIWQRMEQCIKNNTSIKRDELTVITSEKKNIPLGFSMSSISGTRDRFTGCVMIFKDLSGIRKLEHKLKRAERLSYLGKMASWVAHEIRNPLTAIDGFAQLLENTDEKEKINLFTSEIHKGTRRINYIIDDILAFARAKRKIAYVPINMKEMLESITKSIVDTEITIDSCRSPVIEGDIESTRRLFINLVNNSVEAMKDNGVLQIIITDDKKYITTQIVDNGEGISADDVKNIFEPFFTTKQRGTGLGLSIVKKIVDEHKGEIEIAGKQGVGTTVKVSLLKKQEEV